MHGGRELIYEPPMPSEDKPTDGTRAKGTVTEFRRPTETPVVQGDERHNTVIPFRVQNGDERKRKQPSGLKAAGRKLQAPKAIDERNESAQISPSR